LINSELATIAKNATSAIDSLNPVLGEVFLMLPALLFA
jgi:hypothetical protein